jgi:glycosyltransferase involved in cell wall biosynthesis
VTSRDRNNRKSEAAYPLVSVIIPCFNAERWVAAAIDSALAQTHRNIEVIVIDDGSTDGSLDVIKNYRNRIRWETGPNRGGCAARNRGVELAIGDYLQFLDADDLLHPEKLSRQLTLLGNRSHCMSTCLQRHFRNAQREWDDIEVDDDKWIEIRGPHYLLGNALGDIPRKLKLTDPELRYGWSSSWLVSASLIERGGRWDERLTACQDSEFFDRLSLHADTVFVSRHLLAQIRGDNVSSVSKGRERHHAESHLLYCKTSEQMLLQSSLPEAHIAAARRYFCFAIHFYGIHQDLVEEALTAIDHLHVPLAAECVNWKTQWVARILGRRMAIRLAQLKRTLIPPELPAP